MALWIAFRLRGHSFGAFLFRSSASLVMGAGIVGMHYNGMAAARFPLGSVCGAAREGTDNGWLAVVVIVVTLAVLAIASIIRARSQDGSAHPRARGIARGSE